MKKLILILLVTMITSYFAACYTEVIKRNNEYYHGQEVEEYSDWNFLNHIYK